MKKVYEFGDILITAKFTDNWTEPEWTDECRPEYIVTIREAGNKIRHSVTAWGNLMEAPYTQHQSLAGLVLEEHLRGVGTFEDFCGDFGYDTDSRKAERIYKKLLACWRDGYWLRLVENSHAFKLWKEGNKDIEDYLKIVKA